jgi:hypothetical protein
MKITLKKNKMMGGMNTSLKAPTKLVKGYSLNRLPPPPVIGTSLISRKAAAKAALPPIPPTQSISLNDEPALSADMLPYTPSIKEIIERKPELLKTYVNRQTFNLINMSFSTITSFLNIFVIYLENITDISEDQKAPLIIQLKQLLTNINNFKYRYNYNLINTETPINTTLINPIIIKMNELFVPIQTSEVTINNNVNALITKLNTIDNTGIMHNIKELFAIDHNIFEYLINDYANVNTLITTKEKNQLIKYNRQILISTQMISNYFIKNSTNNILLYTTSKNTYNSTIKIHKLLYALDEKPGSNPVTQGENFNEGNVY